MNKILQFAGDIRMWQLDTTTGVKTPVNPNVADAFGNTPVEANASVFSYAAGDQRDVKSHCRDRYLQVIHSDQDPGAPSISLTLVAVPGLILARMFYGDAANTSISAGSVTAEPVTVGALGAPVRLAHRYLSSSPAPEVKDATDTTTYVAGTDYKIDLSRGLITPLTGGAITASSTLHLAYTYTAYELISIRGGVKPTETFYITGDMLNRPDGSDMDLEIYQAVLSNDGDVNLFSEDPLTVTLKGPLVTPPGEDAPFETKQYTKAA